MKTLRLTGATLLFYALLPAAEDQVLRLCLRTEPRTFDPALVEDSSSEAIRYLTAGVLVRVDRKTQQLTPGLATRWRVLENGKRIDLVIRPGVRFSDGTPFTVDDVIFSLKRVLDPNLHSPLADQFPENKAAIEIRRFGPSAVTLRFPKTVAAGASLLDDLPMVSSKAASGSSVTLGPFFVAEHKAGAYIVLKRNVNYWERDEKGRGLPYLSAVRLEIGQSRESETLQFSRGELDAIEQLDPESYARLTQSGAQSGEVRDSGASLDSELMWFNQVPNAPIPAERKQWFADTHFRRAVSALIRRDDLARLAFQGHAIAAVGPVSPANRQWFNAALAPHAEGLTFAEKELASAGFRHQGSTLVDRSGKPVEFSLVTNAGSKTHERILALVQQDLARAGIKLNVLTLDFSSLIERVTRTNAYEACLMLLTNVGLDPDDQMNVWLSSGENHQWHPVEKTPATPWEAEIDKLMLAQSETSDTIQRKKYFDRVQQIVREQEPFIYLVHPNALSAVSHRVKGAEPVRLTPRTYWNATRLSIEPTTLARTGK